MAPAGYGDRVEGVHSVLAAARAGRVLKLYVERSRREALHPIIAAVSDARVTVVDDVRSVSDTDSPQGVVAHCRPISPITLEHMRAGTDAILVLDHIEDPQNVGAIARSALAAGVGGLVISSRRQAPLSASAFKAASGALEEMPVCVVGSIPSALERLKALGCWIVGLGVEADRSLFGLDILTEPVAVVIGAEGAGLAHLTRKRCDVLASIPMDPRVESLNASVSAALASFEIMRVRDGRSRPVTPPG
jgi:23S rRNA (guanosine2251-2'-O)-methyltransferase